MRAEEIKAHLKKEPFHRFRVHVSDGSSYEIRHPELMFVSRREITIGLDPVDENIPEKNVYIDPIHITRIELIDGVPDEAART